MTHEDLVFLVSSSDMLLNSDRENDDLDDSSEIS